MGQNNNSVWLIACRSSGTIAILLWFCIVVIMSSNASASNLALNGDFETGDLSYWAVNYYGTGTKTATVNSIYAYNSNYGVQLYCSGTNPGVSMSQTINLTGMNNLTFRYKIVSNSGTWSVPIYVWFASAEQFRAESIGDWVTGDIDVSGFSGNHNIQFWSSADSGTTTVYLDNIIVDDSIPEDNFINFNPNVSISNQSQQYFDYNVNDTYEDYMYFVTSVWHAPDGLPDLYSIENWLNVEQEGENIQLNNPFSDLQTYHLNLYATTSAPPVVFESFLIASSNEIYINRSYAGSIPPIPDPEPDPDPYEPDPNPIDDPNTTIPDDWNMTIPDKYQNVSWLTNYTGYFDDLTSSVNNTLYSVTGLVIKPMQSLNETVHILRYHISNSKNMVAEYSYLSVIVYYGWGVLPVEMQTIFIGVAAAGACIYLFKRRT